MAVIKENNCLTQRICHIHAIAANNNVVRKGDEPMCACESKMKTLNYNVIMPCVVVTLPSLRHETIKWPNSYTYVDVYVAIIRVFDTRSIINENLPCGYQILRLFFL